VEGSQKEPVIVPYVDSYTPSIKLIRNTLRVLELPTQVSSRTKELSLKDVISQEEDSLAFGLIEAEVYWSEGDRYHSNEYEDQIRRHAEIERLRNRIYDDLTISTLTPTHR